ncbi:hypothetical protein B0H13DRAFT_2524120 [Mycena leptocephala]|nr:hypothetical protein B0H13DRAFT_2524120 [Mycena leptocephala]
MANQTQPTSQFPPNLPFTLDNTLGAAVIGFAASCVVFGILLTQVWTYFSRYNSDSALYKTLVVLILVLEATDQAFIGHFVYFYTVTSAGNPLAVVTGTTTWSIITQQAIGSVVGTIVKCCFASRVYRFSEKNIFITAFIAALALGQLGVALGGFLRPCSPSPALIRNTVFTVAAFQLSSIPAVFNLKTLATISLGLGLLTDVVTAAALSYFLWRMRTTQKNSAANTLITRLVGDAINTGVLTTAVSLSTLLLFDFLEGNLIFGATYFMLSKRAIRRILPSHPQHAARRPGARHGPRAEHHEQAPTTLGRSVAPEVETNMFHLGTRMPSIHEADYAEYPDFDMIKTGYPPEPARCVLLLFPTFLLPSSRIAESPNSCICPQEHGLLLHSMTRPTRPASSAVCCSAVFIPSRPFIH